MLQMIGASASAGGIAGLIGVPAGVFAQTGVFAADLAC